MSYFTTRPYDFNRHIGIYYLSYRDHELVPYFVSRTDWLIVIKRVCKYVLETQQVISLFGLVISLSGNTSILTGRKE